MKKFNLLLSIVMAFVFISGLAYSQTSLETPIPIDPNVKIGQLENGLKYYIRHNSKPENRIEMRLAVNAGSLYETEAQRGLAHFCEHMCFNGTKNFEKNELVDFLEKMGIRFGADLNAYTSFAETVYMLQLPTDQPDLVDKGFLVLEDWANNVTFSDEEIDKERGVITEEWRMGLGASDRMRKNSFPVIFKDSRYAERVPIGLIDVIQNSPYDTLRQFYKDWYRPNLMAVVVVGDIDPDLAEKKIKEHFSYMKNPANPKKRIEYGLPDNNEPLVSIETDHEATNNTVMFFYKHPNKVAKVERDYRQMIINQLYNGMLGNRLDEIGEKADAPFIYASTSYGDFLARSSDAYTSWAMSKENQIDKTFETLMIESQRVKQHGFTQTELDRQKESVLSRYKKSAKEWDKTKSANHAREYVSHFLDKEPIPGIQKELEYVKNYIEEISLQEVNSLAKKWITDKNLVISIQAPEKEGVVVPSKEELLKTIDKVKTLKLDAYIDNVSDDPLLAEIPALGKIKNRKEVDSLDFTEITFANGAKVILKETDFKNDEILFSGYSLGGHSLYSNDDFMSANYASQIIEKGGIAEFDNTTLEKKLAGKVLSIYPWIGSLREGITGNSTPDDFETLLQLNYLYFTAPRKDKEAFDAMISKMKSQFKFMGSSPQFAFYDTLVKTVSQNDPRTIMMPTDKQLESIDLDRAYAIYKERFSDASDWNFFMVGNFNTDSILPMLQTYIGGLPGKGIVENWKNVEPEFPEGIKDVVIKKGEDPKSFVAMLMNGDFEWNPENRLKIHMLMKVLSIKCRESMREDQGGVYGVQIMGQTEQYPEPSYTLTAMWGCSPDNVDELANTVFTEMKEIQENGPYAIDLEKVKESLIREHETAIKENNYWKSTLTSIYYNNRECWEFIDYNDRVKSITGADIRDAAREYITNDAYVKVVLKPEAEQKGKGKKKKKRNKKNK